MDPISPSEVDTYNRCQMAHYFNYGLGLVQSEPDSPANLGSIGHEMLAAFYQALKDGHNYDEAMDAGELAFDNMLMEKPRLFKLEWFNQVKPIVDFYFEQINCEEWEIIDVEHYVKHQFPGGIFPPIHGVIDLVIRPRSKRSVAYGKLVVVDHKFVFNFMTRAQLDMQSQILKYLYILNADNIYGEKIKWGCLNQIRWRTIKNPSFDDMIGRSYHEWSLVRIQNVMDEHLKTAEQIMGRRELPISAWPHKATRILMKDVCKNCDFKQLCDGMLDGSNVQTAMAVHYKPKDTTYREMRKESVLESAQ